MGRSVVARWYCRLRQAVSSCIATGKATNFMHHRTRSIAGISGLLKFISTCGPTETLSLQFVISHASCVHRHGAGGRTPAFHQVHIVKSNSIPNTDIGSSYTLGCTTTPRQSAQLSGWQHKTNTVSSLSSSRLLRTQTMLSCSMLVVKQFTPEHPQPCLASTTMP